jgi:hypothetical protein
MGFELFLCVLDIMEASGVMIYLYKVVILFFCLPSFTEALLMLTESDTTRYPLWIFESVLMIGSAIVWILNVP